MRTLLLLSVFCLVAANSATAQESPSAEVAFQMARDAEGRGDLKEALRNYNRAIELDDRWQFRLQRGLLQLRLEDSQAAADDFDQVIKKIPADSVRNLYFKAVALSNRTLARQNIRRQMHPDLEDYEETLKMAREIVADADPRYVPAAEHLIGITLVLEGELLKEQNRLQEALAKLNEGLASIPQSDHHWLCQGHLAAGRIAVNGPGWEAGLQQLYVAAQEAQDGNEVTALAQALDEIIEAERDGQKQTTALAKLREISFVSVQDPDYWNAWRSVRLAGFYLSNLRDSAAAGAEIRKVAGSEQVRTHPNLRYDLLFSRAHLAELENDGPTLQAVDAEAEEVLKPLEPGSTMALEVHILQMELAAHRDDFKRALSLGESVQEQLFGALGDQPSNLAAFSSRDLAFVLRTLAETYMAMGMLPQGLDLLRRSISLLDEVKLTRDAIAAKIEYAQFWSLIDPFGKEDPQGKPEWRRTLEGLSPSLNSFDPELRNLFHLVYAIASFQTKDLEATAGHLSALDRTIVRQDQIPELLMLEAGIAVSQNKLDSAFTALSRLESSVDELAPVDKVSYFVLKAQVMRKRGDLLAALEGYRRAVDISEGLSAQSPEVTFQANLRDPQASLYDEAIETATGLEKNDPKRSSDELIEFALKALVPPRPVERTAMNPELGLVLNRLAVHRMIFALWPEFHRAHPSVATGSDDLRAAFRRDYARYFSMLPEAPGDIKSNRHLRALSLIQDRSQKPGHQVRLYYLGSKKGLLFVFEGGKLSRHFVIADTAVKRLRVLADQWKDSITALDDEQDAERGAARELLEILFPEGWQNTPPEIEIVAHESLWDVAFETLITSSPGAREVRYLDQDRSISYLTPVTLSRVPSEQKQPSADSGYFFVNPSISTPGVDQLLDDPKLIEAFVASGIPRNHILDARESAERKLYSDAIQHSRWLHFLTHSAPENEWEGHVGLLLTSDPDAAKTKISYDPKLHTLGVDTNIDFRGDGFLSPRDIETMDLRSEFVFLHGCQTAHGRVSFSSGLLGLISAFLAAGSDSVIASHWNVAVRDEISRPVAAFYGDFLKSKLPVEETLRSLRASIRSQGAFGRHPYAWASFSLYR
jgi:tetratricopeptide (TPR) repeat protein/CHAT domain-containing protein